MIESQQLAGSVNLGSGQDAFALATDGFKMGHIWLLPFTELSGQSSPDRKLGSQASCSSLGRQGMSRC